MTLNAAIISQIFSLPPKHSRRLYGVEFFLELAKIFKVQVDEDWKTHELIYAVLHSYAGKALKKAFFDCQTDHDIYYQMMYTEEIYITCYILGLGKITPKHDAASALIEHIKKIRQGLEVEIQALPNMELIQRLNKIYYGKEIQIKPRRESQFCAV